MMLVRKRGEEREREKKKVTGRERVIEGEVVGRER